MASGDPNGLSIAHRIRSLIPRNWIAHGPGTMAAVIIGGLADGLSWITARIAYTKAQTRLATAVGFWLDIAAWDFFGPRFKRRRGELDASFSARLRAEVLRPRATRAAVSQALFDLTGKAPELYEPWNPNDCGAYDVGTVAYSGSGAGNAPIGGMDTGPGGYDVGGVAYAVPGTDTGAAAGAGCYGSYELPNQVFVRVHRGTPTVTNTAGCGAYDMPTCAYGGGSPGVPQLAGYDSPLAGLDIGPLAYFDSPPVYGQFAGVGAWGSNSVEGSVSDDEIYRTVARNVAGGITAWTQILPA